MPLRVQSQLAGGFGTSITVAPTGSLWLASTTNVANIWRGDSLLHTVRVSGYVDGRGEFNADESAVAVGLWTIDTASGEALRHIVEPKWLTATLDRDDDVSPADFAVPVVVHVPGADRAAVTTEFQPSRLKGSSGRYPEPTAQALLVDLGADEVVSELVHDASRYRVLTDSSAHVVAAVSHHDVRVWSATTGEPIASWTIDGTVDAIAVSPDSAAVAVLTTRGDVTICAPDGETLRTWHVHDGVGASLVWDHSGGWIATGSRDGKLGVWDITAGARPELIGTYTTGSIGGLGVMPADGALILAGDVVEQGMTILTLDT